MRALSAPSALRRSGKIQNTWKMRMGWKSLHCLKKRYGGERNVDKEKIINI